MKEFELDPVSANNNTDHDKQNNIFPQQPTSFQRRCFVPHGLQKNRRAADTSNTGDTTQKANPNSTVLWDDCGIHPPQKRHGNVVSRICHISFYAR